MAGGINNNYASHFISVHFTLDDIRTQANGRHNKGEVLLGANGSLVHVNGKVWKTSQNSVVATNAQNNAVRAAICEVVRRSYKPGNNAAQAVMRHLLNPQNANLPLSRDELRKLIQLCDKGADANSGLNDRQISDQLDLIGEFAKLKREGDLTETKLTAFTDKLHSKDPNDNIRNWVKGLNVSSPNNTGAFKKIKNTIYNSVIGRSDNQVVAEKRISVETYGRNEFKRLCEEKVRVLENYLNVYSYGNEQFRSTLECFLEDDLHLMRPENSSWCDLLFKGKDFRNGVLRKVVVEALKRHLEFSFEKAMRSKIDKEFNIDTTTDPSKFNWNDIFTDAARRLPITLNLPHYQNAKTPREIVNVMNGFGLKTDDLEVLLAKAEQFDQGFQVCKNKISPLFSSLKNAAKTDDVGDFRVKLKTFITSQGHEVVNNQEVVEFLEDTDWSDKKFRMTVVLAMERHFEAIVKRFLDENADEVQKLPPKDWMQYFNERAGVRGMDFYLMGLLRGCENINDLQKKMKDEDLETDDLKVVLKNEGLVTDVTWFKEIHMPAMVKSYSITDLYDFGEDDRVHEVLQKDLEKILPNNENLQKKEWGAKGFTWIMYEAMEENYQKKIEEEISRQIEAHQEDGNLPEVLPLDEWISIDKRKELFNEALREFDECVTASDHVEKMKNLGLDASYAEQRLFMVMQENGDNDDHLNQSVMMNEQNDNLHVQEQKQEQIQGQEKIEEQQENLHVQEQIDKIKQRDEYDEANESAKRNLAGTDFDYLDDDALADLQKFASEMNS